MTKVLVDTDVLIDYSKNRDTVLSDLLNRSSVELDINPVIAAEFLADKNLINRQKVNQALEFLELFKMLNINKKTGIMTGEIMQKSPDLNWKDAIIAACCLMEDCSLATRNRKHFERIAGLKFV